MNEDRLVTTVRIMIAPGTRRALRHQLDVQSMPDHEMIALLIDRVRQEYLLDQFPYYREEECQ